MVSSTTQDYCKAKSLRNPIGSSSFKILEGGKAGASHSLLSSARNKGANMQSKSECFLERSEKTGNKICWAVMAFAILYFAIHIALFIQRGGLHG